jgi:hypothetical protein
MVFVCEKQFPSWPKGKRSGEQSPVDWRKIAITLIFRLLTNAPDATRTESSRNLSEMALLQQLRMSQHGSKAFGV